MLFGLRHGHEGICCSAKSYVVMPSLFIVYYMYGTICCGTICYGTLFWDYMLWNFVLGLYICYGTLSWDYIYAMELRSYICSLLLIFAMELCCPVMVLCCYGSILCIKLFNFWFKKRSFAVKWQTAKMPHVTSLCFRWHFAVLPTGRLTAKRYSFAVWASTNWRRNISLCRLGKEHQTAKSCYFAHWEYSDRRQSMLLSRLPKLIVDGKDNRLCRLVGRPVDGKTLDAVRQTVRSVWCNVLPSTFRRQTAKI